MTESLKETVIDAALEVLDREGLNLAYESISYIRVFEHLRREHNVRVTRASVHKRIWDSQDDFRRDVLAESIQHFPTGHLSRTLLRLAVASDGPEHFAIDVGARRYRNVLRSASFGQFQSVKALASRFDDPRATAILHDLLQQRATADLSKARLVFPELLARLGLRPKTELGLGESEVSDILYTLIQSLSDGGHLNYHAGSQNIIAPVRFRSAPTESAEPWCIISIGVKCFLDFLCEEAPERPETSSRPASRAPPDPATSEIETLSSERNGSPRSRRQLKRLILDAAVELLLRGGLQLKVDSLTYAAVFAHIEDSRGLVVNRSSIHPRFWTSNEEFRLEVLARSLLANAHPVPAVTKVLQTRQLARRPDGSIHRRQTAYDLIRTVTDSLAGLGLDSRQYRRLLQVKAALIDQDESMTTRSLRTVVQQIDRDRIDRNKVQIQRNILDLGFVVRPETGLTEHETIDLLVVLFMITISGITLNELAGIESTNKTYRLPRTDGSGGGNDWRPAGLAMRSYFDQLYKECGQT